MLGTEPQIIATYIDDGRARLVFWPMLDHGDASLNAHAAADCIGQQSVDAFWQIHDLFFTNQNELWRADREYFVNAAAAAGVDPAAFGACYDSGEAHSRVTELDRIRRDQGVFHRPTFDINGQLLVGSQSFDVFAQYIEAVLP